MFSFSSTGVQADAPLPSLANRFRGAESQDEYVMPSKLRFEACMQHARALRFFREFLHDTNQDIFLCFYFDSQRFYRNALHRSSHLYKAVMAIIETYPEFETKPEFSKPWAKLQDRMAAGPEHAKLDAYVLLRLQHRAYQTLEKLFKHDYMLSSQYTDMLDYLVSVLAQSSGITEADAVVHSFHQHQLKQERYAVAYRRGSKTAGSAPTSVVSGLDHAGVGSRMAPLMSEEMLELERNGSSQSLMRSFTEMSSKQPRPKRKDDSLAPTDLDLARRRSTIVFQGLPAHEAMARARAIASRRHSTLSDEDVTTMKTPSPVPLKRSTTDLAERFMQWQRKKAERELYEEPDGRASEELAGSSFTAPLSPERRKAIRRSLHGRRREQTPRRSSVEAQTRPRRVDFRELVHNPLGMEIFLDYMNREWCAENWYFHLAVQSFRQRAASKTGIRRLAVSLFAAFIDNGAPHEVTISEEMRRQLRADLSHPHRRMYDGVHRAVLKTMREDVYPRFVNSATHEAVQRAIFSRVQHLAVCCIVDNRSHTLERLPLTSYLADEFELPPTCPSLEDVLFSSSMLAAFLYFCHQEYSEENIVFWCVADEFRLAAAAGESGPELHALAERIYKRHIVAGAPQEVLLGSTIKRAIFDSIEAGDLGPGIFVEAQRQVLQAVREDSFARFSSSSLFKG